MTRASLYLLLSISTILAAPARADKIETPECQGGLAEANRLIEAVAGRDKEFVQGDVAKNCRLLRQNLDDLLKARGPMNRCLTGHDRGENLGQIDGSIADIRDVLAVKCK